MLRALALLSLLLVRMPAVATVVFEDGTFEPVQWEVTQVGSPPCGEDPLFFPVACAYATVSGPCGCAEVSQRPGGFGVTYRHITQAVLGDGQITWFHHLKYATYDPRGREGPLVSLDYAEDTLGDCDEDGCVPVPQATGPAVTQNGTVYIRPGLFAECTFTWGQCTWTHEELRGLVADDFVAIDGFGDPHPDFSGQGLEADATLELGFYRANAYRVGNGPTVWHGTRGGSDNFRLVLDPVCVADHDCEDGDECTWETCAGGRCTRAHVPGFDGVLCELARAFRVLPDVCRTPVNLRRRLRARLTRAERVLAGGRGSARAATRRRRRGLRLLKSAEAVIARAEGVRNRERQLDEDCARPLFGLIERLSVLLGEVDVGK